LSFSFFNRTKLTFLSAFSQNHRKLNKACLLCSELAHKNRQYAQFGDEKGNSFIIQQLREQIRSLADQPI